MVYISTFSRIESRSRHWFICREGVGLGVAIIRGVERKLYQTTSLFWIALALVFNFWKRDLLSQLYLQYWPHDAWTGGKYSVFIFQNVHRRFASLSAFCLPPNYARVTPVKACGSTTGNSEGSSRMYCYSSTSGILIIINGYSLCYLFISSTLAYWTLTYAEQVFQG